MSKKILVIDDAEAIRKSVGYTLEQGGYEVVEACDGVEGLARLKSEKVDMVLCDINMPKLDGIGFLRALKENDDFRELRFTPILMVTTEAGKDKKDEGKQLGAKAWIVKPFKPDQLLKSVKMLIS